MGAGRFVVAQMSVRSAVQNSNVSNESGAVGRKSLENVYICAKLIMGPPYLLNDVDNATDDTVCELTLGDGREIIVEIDYFDECDETFLKCLPIVQRYNSRFLRGINEINVENCFIICSIGCELLKSDRTEKLVLKPRLANNSIGGGRIMSMAKLYSETMVIRSSG